MAATHKNQRYFFAQKQAAKTLVTQQSQAVCEHFSQYLQAQNIQNKNIERYTAQVERFASWLLTNKDKQAEQAEKKDVLDYLLYLQEVLSLTNRTRQHITGILRHYYTFLHQKQEVAANPVNLIKLRGTNKTLLPKVLSLEEMSQLLDTYYHLKVRQGEQSKHIHQRNYVILSLCTYQGLQRAEWQALTLDSVNLQKATITVHGSHKTNARTLPIHATQIGIFYEYLQQARPQFAAESQLLINSAPEVQKLMQAVRKLYPRFTDLKQLRASAITHWIQTEGLRRAQYKAGHRYISSTEGYIANNLQTLQDDISKYHPL